MSKQLIEIKAIYLKSGDLIFDFKTREVQRVDYVSFEKKDGEPYFGIGEVSNVHVSYGMDCNVADNFNPDFTILILIDTELIKITQAHNIR